MRLQKIPPLTAAESFFLSALRPAGADPAQAAAGTNDRFWHQFQTLMQAHHLGGFLFNQFRGDTWQEIVPAPILATLRQQHIQTEFRNTIFRRELHQILEAFSQRNIVPILLKGAALNLSIYDDLGERASADVDLLVRTDELDLASDIMRRVGYRLDESSLDEAFYRQHHYHLIFRHEQMSWCCFELHWDLTLPLMDIRFNAAEVRERAVDTQLDGLPVQLPSPDDMLLHLSQHTGLNAFNILAQIRDIERVIAHFPDDLDPREFWQRAERFRFLTVATVCLELASIFDTHPHRELLMRHQPAPAPDLPLWPLIRLESILRQRALSSAAGGRAVAMLRRDRTRDRWAVLRRQIFPSQADLHLDGRGTEILARSDRRQFSWAGLGESFRTLILVLLARGGWEVEPVDRA
ncbi:MAG: nucleotidyltransferase family protein [bacterium]